MARYTGPVYKKSRRLNFSTLENGKELARKPFPPGSHGKDRRRKLSEYGVQMQEKQKVRFLYNVNEKQFRKIFERAGKMKGVHGENLLVLLESRLDNLVYRLGFAKTRRGARQLVNHGHITVNDKKVDIASYTCKINDVIGIREKSSDLVVVKEALEIVTARPSFVSYDAKKQVGTYLRYPERSELNPEINELLIVEYYSR